MCLIKSPFASYSLAKTSGPCRKEETKEEKEQLLKKGEEDEMQRANGTSLKVHCGCSTAMYCKDPSATGQ